MTILNKFISILLLTMSSVAHSGVLFSTNFENGTINGLSCSGNCPTITSTNSLGKYSSNFTLTRSSTVNYRTETTLGSAGKFQFGKEYWIEFNYRYEDWAKDTNPESAPFQIHATPGSWDATCNIGPAMGAAPFIMISQNDEARFVTYGGKVLWRAPLQKKQWLNMSVHFRISSGSDGFVEAWKDGVNIGRVNGPNSPRVDKCGLPMKEPYFKMGIYKWSWKTMTTDSTIRTLLMDNLTVSDTPLPLTTDTAPPVISGVVDNLTDSSLTVSWSTNETATSRVVLDGKEYLDNNLSTSHGVLLPMAFGRHVITVSSKDAAGNASDDVHTITIGACLK